MNPWLLASRPKTLPAALVPVLVGSALAARDGAFRWEAAALCLGFALLVQIGTNFANDYFDFLRGADSPSRVGPKRAVASGLVSPAAMRAATLIVFAAAFVVSRSDGVADPTGSGRVLLVFGLEGPTETQLGGSWLGGCESNIPVRCTM